MLVRQGLYELGRLPHPKVRVLAKGRPGLSKQTSNVAIVSINDLYLCD